MIDVLPITELIPGGFEKTSLVLSPNFLPGEFNFLLLDQMIKMEEGNCYGLGCQGSTKFPLPEESFSPVSDQGKTFPLNTFDPILGMTFFGSMSLSKPSDGLEVSASGLPYQPVSVQANPLFRGPFPSKPLGGNLADHLPFQSGNKGMAADFPRLEENTSPLVPEEASPIVGRYKEFSNLFQIKGKETVNSPLAIKREDGGPKPLTSLNFTPLSAKEGGSYETMKFELISEPTTVEFFPASENDSTWFDFLKNETSPSELYSIQQGLKLEPVRGDSIQGGGMKGENGFFQRVESSEIYHQVGQKMVWSVRNGEERVRLFLDPPQLGSLRIEIIKDKEMVSATLWAETPMVKELLEAQRVELRRILANDGFNLDRFDVFVQHEMKDFQHGGRPSVSYGGRSPDGWGESRDPSTEDVLETSDRPMILGFDGNRSIDLFV